MFNLLFQKSGLSLDRLRSFCRVAESESFTRAAEGDSNRQTLYSRQVKELEAYFGTELFRRKGRTVVLTDTGKKLYLLAVEYFSALEDFTESCSSSMKSYSIGAGDSLIQWMLIPRLSKIRSLVGRAEVSLQNMRTGDIVDGLLTGRLDFGILREDAVVPDLTAKKIGMLRYALFAPHEAIRGLKGKNPDYLSELTFVGMTGGGLFQRQMEALAQSSKTLIRYTLRCNSYPLMVKAMNRLGVAAILPAIAQKDLPEEEYARIQLKRLESFSRPLVLCWNTRLARMNTDISRLGEKMVRNLNLSTSGKN